MKNTLESIIQTHAEGPTNSLTVFFFNKNLYCISYIVYITYYMSLFQSVLFKGYILNWLVLIN
jgi:hypothetical protein